MSTGALIISTSDSSPLPALWKASVLEAMILHIYVDYDKRLGAYKVQYILKRDYGINISIASVYLLMNSMELPKCQLQTQIYLPPFRQNDHLKQQFIQGSPNLVCVSDITYLKAGRKMVFHTVFDLFLKVVSWHLSETQMLLITASISKSL